VKYSRELFGDVIDEVMPLLEAHWREISANLDIPLDVDKAGYLALENAGMLRVFTARSEGRVSNPIVGYAVYFIKYNLHYKSSLQALQDVLFVHPDHRGSGGKLIMWADAQLRDEGVQVVYHHIKAAHNFGPVLERIGYKLVDLIYQRRLD
jgi:GNAT superfamily N-acetyltransferase